MPVSALDVSADLLADAGFGSGGVNSVDVKNGNGVRGVDVVDDSLTSTDIATDEIQAEEIGTDARPALVGQVPA